jgi:cell wall-associated NlpC family hydrolase
MQNRKFASPILSALVLFLIDSPLVSKGDNQASNGAYPAPANQQSSSSLAPTPGTAPATAPSKHTASYTVVAGDSLTSIARKFNTTRKKLRALNSFTASTVKPGEILLVPAPAITKTTRAQSHHTYAVAQPVQDFDVPASTFASCPVPLPTPEDDADVSAPAPEVAEKPAPIAKLVSPAEMAAEPPPEVEFITPSTPAPKPVSQIPETEVRPSMATSSVSTNTSGPNHYSSKTIPSFSTGSGTADVRPIPPSFNPSAPRLTSRGLNSYAAPSLTSNSSAMLTASANDWGNRFFQQARLLGNEGIEFDGDWRPPGEPRSWAMDCSNTSRYLYKVTAGIQLPRTASDQYYYLHLQGKAWDAPLNSQGFVDTQFLRRNLKPGDLLFWENTYRPERQPPITHVMVYLGTNEKGQWIMAGSQSSRGGEHNRRNGGPDIYVFRPSQPCGGYTTWMGLVHHQGRFCAFGRPLEADPTKLSVADSQ